MVLDNKKNLRMDSDRFSFSSLAEELYQEKALTNLEKCVVLFQMLTYVGDDIFDKHLNDYPGKCSRDEAEQFIKDNSQFVDY
jgi:hypothetical protein